MPYTPFELIKTYEHQENLILDITLCKSDYNRTEMQSIVTAYNKEFNKHLSNIDELTFDIPKYLKGSIINDEYEMLKHDHVIKLQFDNLTQYFIIKEINEKIDGKKIIKSITAYSYEYIFNSKIIIQWIQEQKSLTDTMTILLSEFPAWALGETKASIMVKERTLEASEQTYYDFMTDIQKSFQCYFEFDTVNRLINIKEITSVGIDRGFIMSQSNYMKSIDIEANYANVVTRLYAYGKDNLHIATKTINGKMYLQKLDYFIAPFERESDGLGGWNIIKHSQFMTDDLCNALYDYFDFLDLKQPEMTVLLNEMSVLLSEYDELLNSVEVTSKGLLTLQTELEALEVSLTALHKIGDTDPDLADQVSDKKSEVAVRQAQVDDKKIELDNKQEEIDILNVLCDIASHLTDENLKELDFYIKEKIWRDDSYVYVDDLYEDAVLMLDKLAEPSINFKVSAINYLRSLERSYDWETITDGIGDIVQIDVDSLGMSFKVRLINFRFSEDQSGFELEFSNKDSIDDPMVYLEELLKRSSTTSSTVSMEKWNYRSYYNDRSEYTDWLDGVLDLTKKKAFAGTEQDVILNKLGLQLIDKSNENKQIKMIGDLVVFTNDGWNTIGTALSSSGIFADALYGKVIAGTNLTIENSSSTFKVTGDTVTLTNASLNIIGGLGDSNITNASLWNSAVFTNEYYHGVKIDAIDGFIATRSDNKSRTIINGDGIKIEASFNGGLDWIDRLYADAYGYLVAEDMKTNNMVAENITINSGKLKTDTHTLINVSTKTLDLTGFDVIGGLFDTLGTNPELNGLFTINGSELMINATNIIGEAFTALSWMKIGNNSVALDRNALRLATGQYGDLVFLSYEDIFSTPNLAIGYMAKEKTINDNIGKANLIEFYCSTLDFTNVSNIEWGANEPVAVFA